MEWPHYICVGRTTVSRQACLCSLKSCLCHVYPHMISDTRLPPVFHAFISGVRREPGDEVSREVRFLFSRIHKVSTPLTNDVCTFAVTVHH